MDYKTTTNTQKLVDFVISHTEKWRENRDTNYIELWRAYERTYRGIFHQEDKTKSSERSTIVSPATAQAVDTKVAEMAEATLSTDNFFDIDDNREDRQKTDIEQIKNKLAENFKKDKIKRKIQQVTKIGEIFGTGIGEILVETTIEQSPATRPSKVGNLQEVGVLISDRIKVDLYPIVPFNFLIDPLAQDIDDAMGCAVEEYTSVHKVTAMMEAGEYRPCSLQVVGSADSRLERSDLETPSRSDKVKILRYYGLVPRSLLENLDKDTEPTDSLEKALEELKATDLENYTDLVEAIIVIGDGAHLLKAVVSPYMMQDRPIVCYRPEIEPGRFWGRGTVERGYAMQRALDGQIRAHLDSVALTAAPMVGIDSTKMPRGFKFNIAAGRSVLTVGRPSEAIEPIRIGEISPVNIETANLFERFLQQATGTIDSSALPGQVSNQSDSGALSMALSGIIKKNKTALLNFQEDFLIPFVRKAAWRYMQFDPDNFPAADYDFIPITTMGIMAREYEQQQYMAMMSTLGPESPIVPLILQGILENSSLSNKQVLIQQLQQMSQPNLEQEQIQKAAQMLELRAKTAMVAKEEATAQRTMAEANKATIEAQFIPVEAKAKYISAVSNNLDEDNEGKDFERRVKITELALKERDLDIKAKDIASNERIAAQQMETKDRETTKKAIIEKMKIDRDKDGNLTVTKSKSKGD